MELKLRLCHSEAWVIYKALRNLSPEDSVEESIIRYIMTKIKKYLEVE